jgi:protein ImuB
MFAVVHLAQFPLQAALRHEPELWSRAVALVDPARTTPIVCDATRSARDAGIAEGLTPTQALARCDHILVRHRVPAQELAANAAVLQCAYAFSPHLESTAPGVTTLDLRGLSRISGNEPAKLLAWAGELRTALAAQGLRASIGLAATPTVARHAACWSDGLRLVTDPRPFLDGLPLAALEPSSDVAEILRKWGIRTVGELLALGQEALADRLGLEALALFAAASVDSVRPLRHVQPAEHYAEAFDFEEPVETTEPLLFLLRRFVDQLAPRLAVAGLVAELLVLRLRLDSGAQLERRLRVPQPSRDADILHRMLMTHLETLRTDSPIAHVALTLETTQPTQKQFGLFEAALRDPHQFQETLARLSALLGAERVGTPVREASHRPDAFRLVPPDFENAPAVSGPRPPLQAPALRRLRPAVSASVEGAEQPLAIRCAVANGRLQLVIGPWRASGKWWEPGTWQREEWDAATVHGKTVRLVRQTGAWTVEGVLD